MNGSTIDTLSFAKVPRRRDPVVRKPTDLFTETKPVRSFEDIVRQVHDAIQSGDVTPGDRLASERELCRVFGVSRSTLREALRHLEAQGSVQIRAGATGGVFVATPDDVHAAEALDVLVRFHNATARDLKEFRPAFESETAMWAARRADRDDLAELHRILNELEEAVADPAVPWSHVSHLDLDFHDAVTRASKNRLRIAIMAAVFRAVERASLSLAGVLDQAARRSIVEELRGIVDAIERGDEAASMERMARHVERFSSIESDVEDSASGFQGAGAEGGQPP